MNEQPKLLNTKSKTSLAILHSNKFDGDGKELVVVCGYTECGKFGYFIIKEYVTVQDDIPTMYEYTDQRLFVPKTNEQQYGYLLSRLKEMI